MPADLAAVVGPARNPDRPPRLLGVFAHPDDEVFCAGGTMARCAAAGAETIVVSLTRGEAGQIRDATVATRRTLGATRAAELTEAAAALGLGQAGCRDLHDGTLQDKADNELRAVVRESLQEYVPDVVVTFAPDGAFGHPDHIASCLATMDAVHEMAEPPRLLHARFPRQDQLLLDLLVAWLTSSDQRFTGTAAFGHALKLFADGSSMLGFAADHIRVEWFPTGSFVIEQGEPATELFCVLSGSADVLIEGDDGTLSTRASIHAGSFFGEDGLASGRPRNAHVVARDDLTCLVLAPRPRSSSAGRGAGVRQDGPGPQPGSAEPGRSAAAGLLSVDVTSVVDRKIAALAAHRSQYALDRDLLPVPVLQALLGTEHFSVVPPPDR